MIELKEGYKCGRLILQYKIYNEEKDRMEWHCKCELCKREANYSIKSLLKGISLENKNICKFCKNVKDIRGNDYGRLHVDEFAGFDRKGGVKWLCTCSCPNHTKIILPTNSLVSGNTRSCGCLNIESLKSRAIHGDCTNNSIDPKYNAWKHMKDRCDNSNNPDYRNYGGRGITMHPEWKSDFNKFANDIDRYTNKMETFAGELEAIISRQIETVSEKG